MNLTKRIAFALLFGMLHLVAFAQDVSSSPESKDLMRSNGKIFLVMTIVVVLIAGLFLYLISIDRKITKLEKK